ncbi:MAG: PEP-CTERM sorting domain-containing protein [Cyanobacteria bacterium P01_A01_bin.116]
MIHIIKKQGLKAALPLLLLATACGGDGTPSASFDGLSADGPVDAPETIISANTDAYKGLESLKESLENHKEAGTTYEEIVLAKLADEDGAEKVPEPMTLAGLAVAALGLGVMKRKSA